MAQREHSTITALRHDDCVTHPASPSDLRREYRGPGKGRDAARSRVTGTRFCGRDIEWAQQAFRLAAPLR